MPSTLRDLTELTTVADDDYFLVSDTSDVINRDKKISRLNLLGTDIAGGGAINTGGFDLTVPATGTAVLRNSAPTPVAGNAVRWVDSNKVEDAGYVAGDAARKTGTGTLDRLAVWHDANTIKDSVIPVTDVARLTFTSTQIFNSNLTFYDTGLIGFSPRQGTFVNVETLAVNTAVTVTGLPNIGLFLFYSSSASAGTLVGFVSYRAASTPYVHITPLSTPATILKPITTATPITGTSAGNSGTFNIQCTGTSGVIIFENQTGVSVVYRVMRLMS
jgi:hypothetical protein